MSNCPGCGQDVGAVAMVDLVYLYVPQNEELVEQPWHPRCYIRAKLSPVVTDGIECCPTCGTALGTPEQEEAELQARMSAAEELMRGMAEPWKQEAENGQDR